MKKSHSPSMQPGASELQSALALLRAGRFDQAEAAARKELAKPRPPQALALHSILGSALAAQRRWAEAAASFERVAALNPQSMETHSQLGMLYAQAGRPEDAVASYRRAVALRPDLAELQGNLGILLGQLGRHEEAAEAYARAVAVKPDLVMAHYNRGTALQALGRLDEAEACYRRVLALQPGSAEAHSNLGAVLQGQGQPEAAVACYRAALAIKADPRVHFNLGTALRNQGQLADAARSFEQALALRPDYPDALNNLGEVLRDLGRFDDAVASYERALQLAPDTAEASYNLAVFLQDSGRLDAAIVRFEQARIRDWEARRLQCLYKSGQDAKFRDALRRLLERPESHAAPLLATLAAHHALRASVPDDCRFCPQPLQFVQHDRIEALQGPESALRRQLLIDIESADIAARKQGRLHHGQQSAGNLFHRPEASFRTLSELIASAVDRYRQFHAGASCVFIRSFPVETSFSSSWYVKMQSGGHLTSHIHETGWMSGVVYLAMPPREAGALESSIEFSLDGDDYPRRGVEFPTVTLTPEVGDIVLFPSSLFHRTIPFSAAQERICIAFDVRP